MRKKALLIGNNNYPNITHLRFAANDAECVADSLRRNYGFTDDEIVLMTSSQQGDFYPYRQNMMNKLTELCSTSGSLDLLTIGFWGHGFRIADGKRYLCGPETKTNDLRNTALSFDYVMGCVGQIGAATTILLLDCCQNVPTTMGAADNNTFSSGEADALGAAVRQSTRDVFATRQERGYEAQAPAVAILNSCSAGQRAYVWDEKEHGVFTHFLLEAMDLRKATADDCFEYVLNKMNCGNFWAGQRPCFKSEGSRARLLDDTEVARTPVGPVGAPIAPEKKWLVGKAGEANSERMSESALIAKIKDGAIGWDHMVWRPGIDWVSVFDVFPEYFKVAAPPKRTQERVSYSFADRTAGDAWGEQSSSRTTAAGTLKTVTVNGVEYRFRWCPAGTFMMGSPENEEGRYDDEPQHKVTLTRGFWMQETPVTQRQWESIMGNNPSWFSKSGDGSKKVKGLDTSNFPAENVSWNDVVNEFIPKLNRLNSGMTFRLPTDAEFEYAARSGQNYEYSGSNEINDVAWYGDNSGRRTHEVGTKKANGWGLYDMSGNVWEWCSDWYNSNYYNGGSMTDPRGPNSGSGRVDRGGGWYNGAGRCRSACRDYFGPEYRSNNLGFRLLLESAQ